MHSHQDHTISFIKDHHGRQAFVIKGHSLHLLGKAFSHSAHLPEAKPESASSWAQLQTTILHSPQFPVASGCTEGWEPRHLSQISLFLTQKNTGEDPCYHRLCSISLEWLPRRVLAPPHRGSCSALQGPAIVHGTWSEISHIFVYLDTWFQARVSVLLVESLGGSTWLEKVEVCGLAFRSL